MTDLEMIAAYADDVEKAKAQDKTLIAVNLDEFEAIRRHAETGALLAEVERRWPHPRYDIHISRIEDPGPTWSVTAEDYAEEYARGEGPALIAALRDLLGDDDATA